MYTEKLKSIRGSIFYRGHFSSVCIPVLVSVFTKRLSISVQLLDVRSYAVNS